MRNAGTGIAKYQNGSGIDNKLEFTNSNGTQYYLQDHLGSTVALTGLTGGVTSSAVYDSFGISTNNLGTRYQFAGRESDSFAGLYYNRARWYDPNLGRFISEDPIGFNGGDVNLYWYVRNQPAHRTDRRRLDDGDIQFRETKYYKSLERQSNDL
jgi:RHS repeat-associated protein